MNAKNRIIQACGNTGKMIVARLRPGSDLIESMINICETNEISCGIILGSLGTLEKAELFTAAPASGTKSGVGYSEPIRVKGPIEFINGQGIIMEREGDIFIHFHGMIMDLDRKIYGGHFNPGNNPVMSTIDIIMIETNSVKAVRKLDPELDLELMFPQKC